MRENTLKQGLNAGKVVFGVQYFHSTVGRLLQQSSEAYLSKMR
jgi:hypothetical protein